ncbi:hypothetical protein ACHAXA_007310, partial [Cyclostephanos tholiformis]
DGPSDESPSESGGSASSYSDDASYREGGEEDQYRVARRRNHLIVASATPAPPPPPPTTRPPPPRPHPSGGGASSNRSRSYPTTIEVKSVGQPADRARRKARRREDEKDDEKEGQGSDDVDDDDTGGGADYGGGGGGWVVPPAGGSNRTTNSGGGGERGGGAYVSFGYVGDNSLDLSYNNPPQMDGSVDYSLDEMANRRHMPQDRSVADHNSPPLDEARYGGPRRLTRLLPPPPPRNPLPRSLQHQHQPQRSRKPQVLVHYHPQLGDTGYESTLLDETPPSPSVPRPHKHAVVTNWMHARAIDDLREEKELGGQSTHHHGPGGPSRSQRFPPPSGGNDEHNNAATRQIRRRVLRAAMERSAREWGTPQDERRRKMSEADADIGGARDRRGSGGTAFRFPGGSVDRPSSAVDAFQSPGSVDSVDALRSTPGSITTARGGFADDDDRGVGGSPVDVPPPPSRPPSYKTLVTELIASNEPEKLSQVDRVMEKYAGREEELIKKLDLRYRRKRMKSAMRRPKASSPGGDEDGGGMEKMLLQPPPPPMSSEAKTFVDNDNDKFKPVAVIQTQVYSPPKKLTFIKVDKLLNKNRGVISPMQSWDKSEGDEPDLGQRDAAEGGCKDSNENDRNKFAMPPKIMEKRLLKAVSDSAKTLIHANMMEELDANSSMIHRNSIASVNSTDPSNQAQKKPIEPEDTPKPNDAVDVGAKDGGNYEDGEVEGHVDNDQDEIMMPPKITKKLLPRDISDSTQKAIAHDNVDLHTPRANFASMNLGNQIEDELLELEEKRMQLAEKRMQLEEKMLVNGMFEQEKLVESSQSKPPQSESALSPKSSERKLEICNENSLNLGRDYNLKKAASNISKAYDDGISVITMDTKITLPNRVAHPVGDGDAVYSFDQILKRPPNSITVESSGIGSDGINVEKLQTTSITKLHRVAPEIETEDEKSKLAEASLIASAKLDNVEARIRARYRLMEEEAAKKKENQMKTQDAVAMDTLIEAHDELSDIESMFREAKSKGSFQVDYSEQDKGKEKEQVNKGPATETVEVEKKNDVASETASEGLNLSLLDAVRHERGQAENGMDSADTADEQIIESILSSFDEEEQPLEVNVGKVHQSTRKEETDLQIVKSSHAVDDMGVRQLPRYLSSPNNRGGDSIVSAMSQHSTSMMAIVIATQTELNRLRKVAAFNHERQEDATICSGPAVTNDNFEEEITRFIAEKESRFQAEQAVALLKAQKELETERRARLEAETARVKAEIELERLKSGKILKDEEQIASQGREGCLDINQTRDVATAALLTPGEETSSDQLDHAQLDLEKRLVEVLISSVEAPGVKTDEEFEIPNHEEMAKEDSVVEELQIVSDVLMQKEQHLPDVIDQSRLEAEATRRQAEKELELLRAKRAAVLKLEYDDMAHELGRLPDMVENNSELMRSNSGQVVDEVEEYRQVHSNDDERMSGHFEAVIAEVPQHLSDDENRRKLNDMLETVISKSSSDEREGVELNATAQIKTSQTSYVEICDHDVAERTEPQRRDSSEEIDAYVALSSEKKIGEVSGQESSLEALGLELTSPEKYTLNVAAQEDGSGYKVAEINEPYFPLGKSKPAVPKDTDEEVEAEIHHVAVITFEGNPMKGQLSFITGTKIEAHSNQRGPWWLGRCGTRTGWFPAKTVIPESEFLARFNSPSSAVVDYDESEEVDNLSGDELNAVYDLIRNPSDDQLEQEQDGDDSDDESGSPARSRWLDAGVGKSNTNSSSSRNRSPPPTRSDPSEMAGLSERLYESNDSDSRSKSNERLSSSPTTSKLDDMNTINTNDATKYLSKTSSDGAVIKSRPDADVPKRKPKGDWRAARDPNSGLTYYYHIITKETTWDKPTGFVSRQAIAEGPSPKAASTEKSSKGRRGRGIMNFLTKMAKPPSPASPTKASGTPSSPSVSSPTHGANLDTSVEAKNDTTTHVPTSANAEMLKVDVSKLEQKNSWLTLDDKVSVGDDNSESSEGTYTSIFSKGKIKSVRKWAGKITERLNSPPSQPYKTLNDGTKDPQDNAVSLAKEQPKESPSVASNDGPSREQTELEQPIQSEVNDMSDCEGPITTKNKPSEEVAQDSTNGNENGVSILNSPETYVPQVKPPDVVNTSMESLRKKPQWRFATDQATGRTYYYIRGTSKVTWEKPSEMSD